jgi:hypothetical protein
MLRRALPVALVLAAVAADAAGLHVVATYVLVASVPAAAAAALTVLGEGVLRPGGLARLAAYTQALLAGAGLAAVVVAAAARANAVEGEGLPPLAASAVVAGLGAFALQAFVALLPVPQNGSWAAASFARSIRGWTAKNDAIVTPRQATTATWSITSRGGEPPAGAGRSSIVERM